jgi:tetratricopeptide (TPR) repeat protein
MRILTLSSSPLSDKSFRIGVGVVVIFAAAEILSAAYYYVSRIHVSQAPLRPRVVAMRTPSISLAIVPPSANEAPPPAAPAAPSVIDRLLEEATALRARGDTANALARLQQASERDPKNAKVLEETAKIYESIQNFDRSNETWRKIQEIGPSAGASFELAATRLKLGVPTPAAVESGLPGPSRLDLGTSGTDANGTLEGSNLGITEVTATETPDPDAETNLTLRIGVKKRPNAAIDHTKVKIQVYFYDTVDDKDVKLTNAEVTYEWLTPNHDWAGSDPEMLAVTYTRPKSNLLSPEAALSAAAAAVNPGKKSPASKPGPAKAGESGRRKYLGYIVRVYYHDQLQAVRADPTRLLKLYPPSPTASP